MPPRAISLDIESYGKWTALRNQTCFVPQRALHVDGATPRELAITVCLTPVAPDPRPAGRGPWSAHTLAAIRPGPTLALDLWTHPELLPVLAAWLRTADTLIGMNLQYDLGFLVTAFPSLAPLLRDRHTLIDLSYVAFLEYEARPERGLKQLGPVASCFRYDEADLERLPHLDQILAYNAQDTHNTILAVAEFARRIARRITPSLPAHPSTTYGPANLAAKLSPECINLFSRTIHSCLAMTTAGVPFDRPALAALEARLKAKCEKARTLAAGRGLLLDGEGSTQSKHTFLRELVELAGPRAMASPLLKFTPKRKELSFCDANRSYLASFIPPANRRIHTTLRLISIFDRSRKILSTWVTPALSGGKLRKGVPDRTQLLVPHGNPLWRPDVELDHPSWYTVPAANKGGTEEGGTIQARITCKKGARQTDPPEVQSCYRSRWTGGTLVSVDIDQAELRVPALLSGDDEMVRTFKEGLDIHTRRAISTWSQEELVSRHPELAGLEPERWKKASPRFNALERQVGKRINLADGFLAGAATLQQSVQGDIGETFPLAFFEEIVAARPRVRPGLTAWQHSLVKTARTHGYLCLPFTGQSRVFATNERDGYDVNEIVNFPVQTTAANVLLRIQHFIHAAIRKRPTILMFLNVYDALKFDCATPRDVATLRRIIASAFDWVTTRDLWAKLSTLHSCEVPLTYEIKETAS